MNGQGGVAVWASHFVSHLRTKTVVEDLPMTFGSSGGPLSRLSEISVTPFLMRSDQIIISPCNWGPLVKNQVVVVHDLSPILFPQFFSKSYAGAAKLQLPILLKKSKLILTVSSIIREEIISYYGIDPHKIKVVGAGVEMQFNQNAPVANVRVNEITKTPYYLFVGGHDSRKNLDFLLNIWDVVSKNSNIKLVVLYNPKQTVFSSNRFLEVKNVVYLTSVARNEYEYLILNSEGLLTPSLYEGFNLPILEFLEFQKQVVATHTGIAPELVNKGVTVLPLIPQLWINAICGDKFFKTRPSEMRWDEVATKALKGIDEAFKL